MKSILKQVLSGIDGMPSTKRVLMLYIGIVIWTFLHVALFYIIKPFPKDLTNTVIAYDFALICLLGGMNVTERAITKGEKKEEDDPAN